MLKLSPLAALIMVLAVVTVAAAGEQAPDSLLTRIIPPDTLQFRLAMMVRLGGQQLQNGDSKLAGRTFSQVLKLAPNDPRAHLGLGRSYLIGRDNRIIIFQALERLFRRDNISRAVGYLKTATELAPDWWEAHYWLGSAYMRQFDQADTEQALYHMRRAYELGGLQRDIILKLAVLHKATGDLDNAERILRETEERQFAEGDPLVELELARINFYRAKFADGLRYYWQGVEDITSRVQMQPFFNDLAMLADKKEHEEFKAAGPEKAVDYFRSFWLKRDHEMGLTPGVRVIQHYSRLQDADSLYRVPFLTRSPSIHTSMGYIPNDDLRYDDRGMIYIRHGRPDRTVSHTGEGLHPNETWVYHRDDGEMILNFVALKGNYEYQLVTSLTAAVSNFRGVLSGISHTAPEESHRLQWMTDLYQSRMEIGNGIYARLASNPYDPFTHVDEYDQNIVSLRKALTRESVPYPYNDKLESSYDLVEFRGHNGGKSMVEFYSGVPGKAITFHNSGNDFEFEVKSQLAIYDQNWNQVVWHEQLDKHEFSINPHDLMDRQVVGLGRIDLAPGDYFYFIKIQNGGSVGVFNGQLAVGAYREDSLQASQVIAARQIFPSPADSGTFLRHGLEVEPEPSRTFHPSQKMYAYQEIYNLVPDTQGRCYYRITYSISLLERDRNVFGRIFDSFRTLVGASPGKEKVILTVEKEKAPVEKDLVTEELAIDITDTENGLYELSIRIEDLNQEGRTFQRNARFFVRD
ncbi:tetratricopeptide repeat protein [Gemmatimonadota bacterium]